MTAAQVGPPARLWHIGDVVVAIVDDEFTINYLDRERGAFVLRPANKAYPTIRPKGKLEIFGVMAGLVPGAVSSLMRTVVSKRA